MKTKLLSKKGKSSKVSLANEQKEDLLMKYLEAYQGKCQLEAVRKKMVQYADEHGPLAAADVFECHRNTVSKWKTREKSGESLKDRSRRPHNIPHKITDKKKINHICYLRDMTEYGSERLEKQFNLKTGSNMSIHRILREADKIKKPQKKSTKRKRLWAEKKRYKSLETKLQLDGKALLDIPRYKNCYLRSNGKLPTHMFNLRCVKSGISFASYMNGETKDAACVFIVYAFEHLKNNGIDVSRITIQIDAGAFAVHFNSAKLSDFFHLVEVIYKARVKVVPGGKTKQSDVETFNGLVENEFFRRFDFYSEQDLYLKTFRYLFYFNFIRKNRNKDWETPLYYLMQDKSHIDPHVMTLPPLRLEQHTDLYSFKLNPKYIPTREQMLLNLEPEEYQLQDFLPEEKLQPFIRRIENTIQDHAHDVPICHNFRVLPVIIHYFHVLA
jgi:hypothetical protein